MADKPTAKEELAEELWFRFARTPPGPSMSETRILVDRIIDLIDERIKDG